MRIIAETAKSDIATVYIAEMQKGKYIEFVESTQPPIPRDKKWVLILSTLYGCPVGCRFCDSGWHYQGKISKDEMFEQIDYLITRRFPDRIVPVDKFKIQFARMGEPSLNSAVLDVLDEFSDRYDAPGFLPSISTVAPIGRELFFDRLLDIKKAKYKNRFQLQFSIHTTRNSQRDEIIPVKKWSFRDIANYAERFYSPGDRKITLNFALFENVIVDARTLKEYFNPELFIIKLTPINPTSAAKSNNIISEVFTNKKVFEMVRSLEVADYEVILSIGELEENKIGSNCGQFITNFLMKQQSIDDAYTYPLVYNINPS